MKKEQEKEKKKAVTSSISSILKAKERSTKKQPVVKTDSDEDDEMEVSTKGKRTSIIESAQDFWIKLDMKPFMHLVEISIFSLNHVIVRLTNIVNNLLEHLKICSFKVIFLC